MKAALRLALIGFLALSMATCQKEFSTDAGNNPGGGTPAPTPGATVTATVKGRIIDGFGDPVKGVAVSAGTTTVQTDVNGEFELKNASLKSDAAFIKAQKSGFFPASRTFVAKQDQQYFVEIELIPRQQVGSINAATGGTINVGNGSAITIPANSVVVESSGMPYNGMITVDMAWIDPSALSMFRQMPGDLRGMDETNTERSMQSYGMLAVELTGSGGEKLQIATGKTASLKFPIPSSMQASAPATIALWSFNETTGLWKQEGTAIKSGNAYTGNVSHFSYWNCDIPITNSANFTANFVDQTGQPVRNIHVYINYASGQYTGAHGGPDSSGYLTGRVPANQSLVMVVHLQSYGPCQTPVFTQPIGPFAPSSNNNLGNITISFSGLQLKTLSGTAVDCAGAPITNGYAELQVGWHTYRANITSGNFSVSFLDCAASQSATYFVVNNAASQQSTPVTTTITAGNNNVGSVSACGVSSLNFIDFSVDGTSYSLSAPTDTAEAGHFPATARTYVSGTSMARSLFISFEFHGATVGSFPLSFTSIRTPTFNDSLATMATLPNISITEFGGPGGYISGSFSGTLTGSGGVTHPVQCNFRVRRKQ